MVSGSFLKKCVAAEDAGECPPFPLRVVVTLPLCFFLEVSGLACTIVVRFWGNLLDIFLTLCLFCETLDLLCSII